METMFQNRIQCLGLNVKLFCYGESISGANPVYALPKNKDKAHFAVKYFAIEEVYIIWDLQRHREKKGMVGSTVSITTGWENLPTGRDVYHVRYQSLNKRGGSEFQKICIVGTNHFDKFFSDIYEYMKINSDDLEFHSNLVEDAFSNEFSRERYSSSRWKRDADFRYQVLSIYKGKCALCRCNIQEVLQAAHEHGYEPGYTDKDEAEHGICLCANHHLMYDRNLIKISISKNTVEFLDAAIEDDPINRVFLDVFQGKMLEREE